MATKKKEKTYSAKEIQDKILSRHQNVGVNKEIKVAPPKGTVEVTNILPDPFTHKNGVIKVGGKGKVTPYEADLYRRKKQII